MLKEVKEACKSYELLMHSRQRWALFTFFLCVGVVYLFVCVLVHEVILLKPHICILWVEKAICILTNTVDFFLFLNDDIKPWYMSVIMIPALISDIKELTPQSTIFLLSHQKGEEEFYFLQHVPIGTSQGTNL